ncbi:MAG: PD40 domain-containing protein [Bacteroidales bacterium]|nr:PD40 domain-containing protein [Bacteroidales bacterium]
MLKIRLISVLVFISSGVSAQNENEINQFSNTLNQFLNVRDFSISKDGNEAFFTIQSPFQEISQIAYITKEKNEWTKPELLPFSDSFMYLEPFLSIDGKRLFFVSDRPLDDSIHLKKDFDIWYVERNSQGEKWSEPKNLGKPINSHLNEFYPSVSENNNLYFTMESPNGLGKDDIYFCRWDNGKYTSAILLDENINSAGYEFNAFISGKEDYIIFTKYNEKDGYGSGDLYISKKDANGKWTKAKNIGVPINTKYMEYCPFYDEKNQILYFTSKRNDVTPREFKNVSDLQKYISESNNGLSKIYMTKLKIE